MISKVNKHQIFFILFSLAIFFGCVTSKISFFDLIVFASPINYENIITSSGIIFVSIFLVGTFGIAHGAMDGKIIWEHSRSNSSRFKLYGLYSLLVFFGATFWLYSPISGLVLLLLLSCIHFGLSDLSFIPSVSLIPKICWGFTMTFLPILFKPILVNDLFYALTLTNINAEIYEVIRVFTVFTIFILIGYLFFRLSHNKDNNITFKLTILELLLLIVLAYYLEPLLWFTLYFCGLHGLRAILILNFKLVPDIFWMILFTAPITLLIFLTDWNYSPSNLLVIFPVLASLTIAHMLLPRMINLIKA